MSHTRPALLLALALLLPAPSRAETGEIDLLWGQKIPLRDGVRLNATIFKPAGSTAPLPVIFTFTPYISDTYNARATYFAHHGYVFALVDVRGRGNSEGRFEPFEHEGKDGADVVEWLARQPFSNGKVGMWGGSYAGYDQWAVLKEFPPHLATIVPAAAAAAAVDFPYANGIAGPYLVQWATYTSGATPNLNLFLDQAFWISKFHRLYTEHGPFRSFDRLCGNPLEWFQKVLQHPTDDAYWQAMRPTAADFQRIGIPILTITAHYDDDQPGALFYYRSHMAHGTEAAKARHYLILGPWDHAGTRTPKREVGGLVFGEKALTDMNDLHRQWYDWTMKDGPRPALLQKRVLNYVMDREEWTSADTLEELTPKTETLYLSSGAGAGSLFKAGGLRTTPGEGSDTYVNDPLDTRPGEWQKVEIPNYLTDQHLPLSIEGDGLVYQTDPLPKDQEITGAVSLKMFLKMDVPDTDLEALLYLVEPEGRTVLLTADSLRARYRESYATEHLVTPGVVLPYDFHSFTVFSWRVRKGSRLRLLVHSPNSIFLEKNYNSGGVVADETAAVARTAHVTLVHDAQHPSALTIPLGRD
jgi:putative CocE/NonD family hydrolase